MTSGVFVCALLMARVVFEFPAVVFDDFRPCLHLLRPSLFRAIQIFAREGPGAGGEGGASIIM